MNKGRGIAGKGARDLADRRYISRQKYVFPLLLICGTLLIFLVSVGFHSNLGFGALILPLIALLVLKAVGRRIDQSVKEERRAIRGAKGEELEEKLGTKIWIKPILVFTNADFQNSTQIRNVQVIPKAYLLNAISRSPRSSGAWKLWQNKRVLAEIFSTISFPPKTDLSPEPPTLPASRRPGFERANAGTGWSPNWPEYSLTSSR